MKQFIRLDQENRVIAYFNDYDRTPLNTDIEVAANAIEKPIFFNPIGSDQKIYLFKYVDGSIMERTEDEFSNEIIPIEPDMPIEEKIKEMDEDIQTLAAALAILLEG